MNKDEYAELAEIIREYIEQGNTDEYNILNTILEKLNEWGVIK